MAQPSTSAVVEEESTEGVRVVVLELPEDEGEGLGFRLTRTLWDPYPWVRDVSLHSRADTAGLKAGDCLLQADGKDLLGLPVGQVAGVIRGDGAGGSISLLVWNCGVDPKDDPDLLWSCGGGIRGEKSRRALSNVIRALACSVCASTATKPLSCARSHLYCEPCWMRLERCALCRESLPPKSSPYSRNLIAEQVFEAIATEYEVKNPKAKQQYVNNSKIIPVKQSTSAYNSPNHSPSRSPNLSLQRKGQYKHSMMKQRKVVHFPEKYNQTYASDPNIHRSVQDTDSHHETVNPTITVENINAGNSVSGGNISCQSNNGHTPKLNENCEQCTCKQSKDGTTCNQLNSECSSNCNCVIRHRLVTKLRQACSLANLHNSTIQCTLSKSLNNLGDNCRHEQHYGSLDNMQKHCNNVCDSQVYLLPVPSIYVVTCDHNKNGTPLTQEK